MDQAEPLYIKLQQGRGNQYNPDTFDLSAVQLPIKYPTPIKLNDKKVKDLKDLLVYIHYEYKEFVETLLAEQEGLDEDATTAEDDPENDMLDYN